MMVLYMQTLPSLKVKPRIHLHYAERALDMKDGLPKYVDEPGVYGGSDKTIEEPETTGWRQ